MGFLWNRLLDGTMKNNIGDYGYGILEGINSVPKGVYRYNSEFFRHCSGDKEAAEERDFVKEILSNEAARSALYDQAKQEVSDLSNYSARNIGKLVGRGMTSLLISPLGMTAPVGDAAHSLHEGGNLVRAVLFGDSEK
jgi:hypothetical protein